MSSNRLRKGIRELDSDVVSCEKYLSKILSRKIEKPRIIPGQKSKQNDNQNRTVKPFLTGPTSKNQPSAAAAGLKGAPLSRKGTCDKAFHKECTGNNKASVEVTVNPKSRDKRRRSLSTGSVVQFKSNIGKKMDENHDCRKQTNLVDPLPGCKLSSTVFQRKRGHSRSPVSKRLPWAEVLKENNVKTEENAGISRSKCHCGHDGGLSEEACLDTKEVPPSTKPVIKSRTNRAYDQFYRKLYDRLETRHLPSRATSVSDESSGFSSSIDEVEFVNKSVQCWIPQSNNSQRVSSTIVSSTKLPEEARVKSATTLDPFSMFNPLRTVNFLVKELHGLVKKGTEDQNLRRIIVDLEKALLRIPAEMHRDEIGSIAANLDSHAVHMSNHDVRVPYPVSDLDTVPQKLADSVGQPPKVSSVTAETVARTLASVPELALKVDSSVFSTVDNNSGRTSLSLGAAGVNSDTSGAIFQKQLEDSCMKLEAMCQEMESTNCELRKQRDKLEEDLKSKDQELEAWMSKERDYLQTISILRTNLESSASTLAELTALTTQLREENKCLLTVREGQFKLEQQLHESMRANEQLEKEIRLLKMEREKLAILNQGKDGELERLRKEVTGIKSLVIDQINALRSSVREREPRAYSSFSAVFSNDTDVDSVPSEPSDFIITPRRPVCSSRTSSKNSSVDLDASWQMISSIPPLRLEESVANEVLVLSPIKEKGSFKSLEPDSMSEMSDMDKTMTNQPTVIMQQLKQFADTDKTMINQPPTVLQSKRVALDLKDELQHRFEEITKQVKLNFSSISVPSPPHRFHSTEPDGISQWTESKSNSPLNSGAFSLSEAESKQEMKK